MQQFRLLDSLALQALLWAALALLARWHSLRRPPARALVIARPRPFP